MTPLWLDSWRNCVLPLTRPAAEPVRAPAQDPGDLLTSWLSSVAEDDLQPRLLRLADGRLVPLPVARWAGPVSRCDEALLERVTGPVLDVGCGPGRLTAALHARGVDVLGLELLPAVPVLAQQAGAPLLVGDVFGAVPRAGQWRTVLLADGNIGIGGDAVRLLRRVRELLAPDGQVVCELLPQADDAASGPVRLEGLGATSAWFRWAMIGPAGLRSAAAAARLSIGETWARDGRTFATLAPARDDRSSSA